MKSIAYVKRSKRLSPRTLVGMNCKTHHRHERISSGAAHCPERIRRSACPRRLIEKVIVNKDKFTVEIKSCMTVDVNEKHKK